jgi:hypothetical protein
MKRSMVQSCPLQYGFPGMVDVSVQGILSEVEGSEQLTSLNQLVQTTAFSYSNRVFCKQTSLMRSSMVHSLPSIWVPKHG